jgi:hypothetical protein
MDTSPYPMHCSVDYPAASELLVPPPKAFAVSQTVVCGTDPAYTPPPRLKEDGDSEASLLSTRSRA